MDAMSGNPIAMAGTAAKLAFKLHGVYTERGGKLQVFAGYMQDIARWVQDNVNAGNFHAGCIPALNKLNATLHLALAKLDKYQKRNAVEAMVYSRNETKRYKQLSGEISELVTVLDTTMRQPPPQGDPQANADASAQQQQQQQPAAAHHLPGGFPPPAASAAADPHGTNTLMQTVEEQRKKAMWELAKQTAEARQQWCEAHAALDEQVCTAEAEQARVAAEVDAMVAGMHEQCVPACCPGADVVYQCGGMGAGEVQGVLQEDVAALASAADVAAPMQELLNLALGA